MAKKLTKNKKSSHKELSVREKLVSNILYYAGDQYKTRPDYYDLATETESQLLDRLITILDYYYDQVEQENS